MPRMIPPLLMGGSGTPTPIGSFDPPVPTTEAEFKTWLIRAQRMTALIEITAPYQTGSGPYSVATSAVFLSSRAYSYVNEADYVTTYNDVVSGLPTWSSSLDEDLPVGRATASYGSIEIDNTDQRSNYLIQIPLQGRYVGIYLGDHTWSRDAFRLVHAARVDYVESLGINRIAIRLKDAKALADRRITGTSIGGTTVNADRFKPKHWGKVYNVEGLLGTEASKRYWLCDSASSAINDVRDRGISLHNTGISFSGTSGGTITVSDTNDTIQHTSIDVSNFPGSGGHVVVLSSTGTFPAGLAAGQYWTRDVDSMANTFKLALTNGGSAVDITGTTWTGTLTVTKRGYYNNGDGSIDLAANPAGDITADLAEGSDVTLWWTGAADGLFEKVCAAAGLSSSDYANRHVHLNTGGVENANGGLYINQPTNLADLLTWITTSGGAFWAQTYDGKIQIGDAVRTALGGTSSDFSITDDDLVTRDALTLRTTRKSYAYANLYYNRNWTLQDADGLASAVTLGDREKWATRGPVVPAGVSVTDDYKWSDAPYRYYEGAENSQTSYIDTLVVDPNAWSYLNQMKFSYWLRCPPDILEAQVGLEHYDCELGDLVGCTFYGEPLGINSGSQWVLIGKTLNITAGVITLKLARLHYWATPTTLPYTYG